MDWGALGVSFKLALATSVILLVVGIPTGAWLAFTRSRVQTFAEAFLLLPFVLPPTVLGFYLLLAFAPVHLAFTFGAILVGSVIMNAPLAVQAFVEAFRSVDRSLVEGYLSLGATERQTFYGLILKMSWPGVLSGLALAFAHTFGEFGVAMMVGGNIAGQTRTMSIAIYDSVQSFNYEQARATAAVQLGVCFVFLTVIAWLKARQRRVVQRTM